MMNGGGVSVRTVALQLNIFCHLLISCAYFNLRILVFPRFFLFDLLIMGIWQIGVLWSKGFKKKKKSAGKIVKAIIERAVQCIAISVFL